MNANIRRSGLRRTLLSVCLAAALGSGSAFGAHNNKSQHNPPAPSWGQLQRTNTASATAHKDWRTRPSRVSTRLTTGGGGGPTVLVTSCADSGPGTLREAATNAVDDTVIDMSGLSCPGSTISLTSGAIEIVVPNLYLAGPGADALTIDGGGTDRVLTKTPGTLGIFGLSLTNGKANGPGGCIMADGEVRLESSIVTGCRVVGDSSGTSNTPYYLGGGIASATNVVLYGSIVSGNEVSVTGGDSGMGGGVFGTNFAVALDDSRIQNNTVTTIDGNARGGGVYSPYGVYLEHAHVTGNSVISTNGTAYGGGVSIYSSTYFSAPPPPLTGTAGAQSPTGGGGSNDLFVGFSTISGNTAHSENAWAYGGGISINGGAGVDLLVSTISGNTASSACDSCWISGGGVGTFGAVNAYYSTISDNQTVLTNSATTGTAEGGGLYADDVQLFSSTISGNRAEGPITGFGHGGGIYSSYGLISANSTIAFNEASTQGGGVYADDDGEWASTIVANNHAPTGADVFGGFTVTGDHNLVMAPDAGITLPADTLSNDPLLLPLHGNGGSTATHALAVCSPAIDAGSNPEGLTQDQRGEPFSRSWGASQDIGAFELQPDPDHIFGNGFDPDPCSS